MAYFYHIRRLTSLLFLLFSLNVAFSASGWYQKESEHFIIVYRESQAYLVPHILQSAERALERLSEIFRHQPEEKIFLATFDFSDHGSAGALTVPRNMIRLEIEPFELGYESMPHHDRIQWLMNHELVHIMVNDQASKAQSLSRKLFSRVPPEQEQPLSVGFSLLTSHSRFTPRWHQEGIATFMETWLGGGYGRTLAGFDEMYFRSLVLENNEFLFPGKLDIKSSSNSFLLGMLNYLYGTRFISYLAVTYDTEKILEWYRPGKRGPYKSMEARFKEVFDTDLNTAWDQFRLAEQRFQQENLARLETAPFTPIQKLTEKPLGWVTQAYLDPATHSIVFGYHQSHQLTALNTLNLDNGSIGKIGTLPSPSILQIASTAFDPTSGLFFYTTNNNTLFRDIQVQDIKTGQSKMLFENVRTGQLTVSPQTHELWGIRHAEGRASLVYAAYPYETLIPVMQFEIGDVLQHLAISPDGQHLAATLHQSGGEQSVIVADIALLKGKGRFVYHTLSKEGSPEFPSWSPDGEYLYWNAYINGVSNIFRSKRGASGVKAMSHTNRGLFRPVYVNADTLFAFEFTSEGFVPVLIPNRPAERLPAIAYYGQQVVEHNPHVAAWNVTMPTAKLISQGKNEKQPTEKYKGFTNIKLHSLIPVVSGFQDQLVLGMYTRMADPFFVHDLWMETGFSSFKGAPGRPGFHFKGRYTHRQKYHIELEYNASSSYDLFNRRKAGLVGTKAQLGHARYLKYDNPHTIRQNTDLSFYRGIRSMHENFVPLDNPDFVVLESSIHSRNLRRAIGSVDSESGQEWKMTFSALGSEPSKLKYALGLHGEWGQFHTWLRPHNILHFRVAAGYQYNKDEMAQAMFYFGGFGNRLVENRPVKQFREAFHFPGIPVYSLRGNAFGKVMLENNLPPLRFSKAGFRSHLLSHIDASVFSQGLLIDPSAPQTWVNVGGQINLVFKHWYNLESTLSVGAAQAWDMSGGYSREWFISMKLLRN